MRFAYADPPYHGMGASLYGHPEWDSKATHGLLVQRLVTEFPDGWALSCNPRDLSWLLPDCPEDVRVCAWGKTYHQWRPVSVQYAWEPVILSGGRPITRRTPMVRDWYSCSTTGSSKSFVGSKPPQFCRWVLLLLGYQEGDQLVDLFPGSGVMDRVKAQGVLA